MIFLIVYSRSEGRVIESQEFRDMDRRKAEDSRIQTELSLNRTGVEYEVVLLEAESKDALLRTHRRYFEDLSQILSSAGSL
jgi:hypothetical protein